MKKFSDDFNFMNFQNYHGAKEVSGYTLQEKNKLYEILTNYGMPSNDIDDQRDDYELLWALLQKHMKCEDNIPDVNTETIKVLERFISQLHIVS